METTLVFLPGESHGQRSLGGYSSWGSSARHDRSHVAQHTAHSSLQISDHVPCTYKVKLA